MIIFIIKKHAKNPFLRSENPNIERYKLGINCVKQSLAGEIKTFCNEIIDNKYQKVKKYHLPMTWGDSHMFLAIGDLFIHGKIRK